MNTIGERIQYLLDQKKYTPAEFCRETGFSEATISRILTKNRKPQEGNLKLLAKFFHVSESWILRGEISSHASPSPPGEVNEDPPVYSALTNEQRIDRLLTQNDRLISILEKRDERIMSILETQVLTIHNLSENQPASKNVQGEAS